LGKLFCIETSVSVQPENPWTFGLGVRKAESSLYPRSEPGARVGTGDLQNRDILFRAVVAKPQQGNRAHLDTVGRLFFYGSLVIGVLAAYHPNN
jgi:hypothetical protein